MILRAGLPLLFVLGVASAAPMAASSPPERIDLPGLGESADESLSRAAERRLGELMMRRIRAAPDGVLDDPELETWLGALATRLAARSEVASGQAFELFGIDHPSINAFALPGGFIGVHTGLIIQTQSESELASVIAHEIAHVTQRHIARMLEQQQQSGGITIASLLAAILAARASPQAAGGLIALGGSLQMQQMLGFSREAEREADRVGLTLLRDAGFDPQAMVSFFGRLQAANRLQEHSQQSYFRTHPFTGERMTDIQNRVLALRYRQHASSVEFSLIRVRLAALVDRDPAKLAYRRGELRRQVDAGAIDRPTGEYGLAAIGLALKDHDGAMRAIDRARQVLGTPTPHPFIESMAAEIELSAERPERALSLVEEALKTSPDSRALLRLKARAMRAAQAEPARTAAFLRQAVLQTREDPRLWEMLAQAESELGRTGQSHRAMAQRYALSGSLPAAVEQLELALRSRTLDFFEASETDVALRALRARYLQESALLKGLR
jgi:predicted Zn-dependent protease